MSILLAQGPSIWHKPAMQLFVGHSSPRGSIKRYPFDLLEMPISSSLPRNKTLRGLHEQRPELRFSLRLHPDVILHGPSHEDITRTKEAALALGASVVVVPTGPRFTPTARNQRKLKEVFDALRADGQRLAWEPRGVWAPAETQAIGDEFDALLVRDLTRELPPEGPVIYTRLLPFGVAARVSQNATEILASHLENAEEAYVIVQSEGAKMLRDHLRQWFELEDG